MRISELARKAGVNGLNNNNNNSYDQHLDDPNTSFVRLTNGKSVNGKRDSSSSGVSSVSSMVNVTDTSGTNVNCGKTLMDKSENNSFCSEATNSFYDTSIGDVNVRNVHVDEEVSGNGHCFFSFFGGIFFKVSNWVSHKYRIYIKSYHKNVRAFI